MPPKTAGWDELAPRGGPRGRAAGVARLHLRPARSPRARAREPQGDRPQRTPRRRAEAAEPLAVRRERCQGVEGGIAGARGQSRRGEPDALHVAHLRHRHRAGPGRRAQEPHRPVPRLRPPRAERVGRHPPVPGARVEEARHPRRRRLRERPAPRGHRVQEPHHRRRLEGRGGEAAPPLPGGRLALEGPGRAAAVRGGAGARRHLRRARRLRHGRHAQNGSSWNGRSRIP